MTAKQTCETVNRIPLAATDSCVFRDLEPVDLVRVAMLHRAAFSGSALSKLGVEVVRRYYQFQLTDPHEHFFAKGAFIGSDVAAFCIGGVLPGISSEFLRKNVLHLAASVMIRPWVLADSRTREAVGVARFVVKRAAAQKALGPAEKRPPKTRFGIEAIAVHPSCQRLGLGKALLEHAEEAARAGSFVAMGLSVRANNQQAIKFYERLQWTPRRQKGPNVYMEKVLA